MDKHSENILGIISLEQAQGGGHREAGQRCRGLAAVHVLCQCVRNSVTERKRKAPL